MQDKLIEQLRAEILLGAERDEFYKTNQRNLTLKIEQLQTKLHELKESKEISQAEISLVEENETLVKRVNDLENAIIIISNPKIDRQAVQNTLRILGFASLDLLYKPVDNF